VQPSVCQAKNWWMIKFLQLESVKCKLISARKEILDTSADDEWGTLNPQEEGKCELRPTRSRQGGMRRCCLSTWSWPRRDFSKWAPRMWEMLVPRGATTNQ
jgi:hypothetical protein